MKRAPLPAVPLAEARRIFFGALEGAGCFETSEEEVATSEALWRVTSRAVFAQNAVPHFAGAAMDGITVVAATTQTASLASPLRFRRGVDFEFVDTGDPIPEKFDAVIKIEDVQEIDAETVVITKPTAVGKHIRTVGEDFARGAQVVPANFQLTPEAIAALLNTGNLAVRVKHHLRAIFIPTGSELISFANRPGVGQFRETNSQIVKGYVQRWGGAVALHAITPNQRALICDTLQSAIASYDVILVGSGTSKGRGDLVPEIVKELGQVLVHGVAYHPGHPVLLGTLHGARPKPVIGLPGYPVATWLALWLFVKPLLERYYYGRERELPKVQAKLAKPIKSMLGYREFVRVKLERAADGSMLAHPLQGGASKLSTIVEINGWIEVPEDVSTIDQGEGVEVTILER